MNKEQKAFIGILGAAIGGGLILAESYHDWGAFPIGLLLGIGVAVIVLIWVAISD